MIMHLKPPKRASNIQAHVTQLGQPTSPAKEEMDSTRGKLLLQPHHHFRRFLDSSDMSFSCGSRWVRGWKTGNLEGPIFDLKGAREGPR